MKKILTAAALAAFAISGYATVITSTTGNVTTLTEKFDGGTSFKNVFGATGAAAGWRDVSGSTDDYLAYRNSHWQSAQGSTLTFETLASSSRVVVSFYYSFWNPDSRNTAHPTIALDGVVRELSNLPTGNVTPVLGNNPGADSANEAAQADQLVTFEWLTVGAKADHKLSFSSGAGQYRALNVDDLKITITAVPEPETYAMLLAGLGVMGAVARRRKAKQA